MAITPQVITPNQNHAGVEVLAGFSITEDAAATAYWRLREASVSGPIFWHLKLAAGQSASIIFPEYMSTEGGVYVEEVSGSATGVLFKGNS